MPPGRGIDRLEDADALDAEAEGGEEQREDAPAHAVIQIVDEAGLRGGEEIAIAERGEREDFAETDRGSLLRVGRALQPDMIARVSPCHRSPRHRRDRHHRLRGGRSLGCARGRAAFCVGLPPATFAEAPDAGLLAHVERTLSGLCGVTVHRGAAWTTDVPYRETEIAIASARDLGALAVEMEFAAVRTFADALNRRSSALRM